MLAELEKKLSVFIHCAPIAFVLGFLAPIHDALTGMFILTVADLVTGVIASVWKKKEAFTSRALRRTITKVFGYFGALVLGMVAQEKLVPDYPVIASIASLIGLAELVSNLENISKITGIDFSAVIAKFKGASRPGAKGDAE